MKSNLPDVPTLEVTNIWYLPWKFCTFVQGAIPRKKFSQSHFYALASSMPLPFYYISRP
jgi:hypothetical protein